MVDELQTLQVMPFIQGNISKNTGPEDWRMREAATFAFGLILDGPEPSAFNTTIKDALGFLLQAMKVCMQCLPRFVLVACILRAGLSVTFISFQDPNALVRDTTAWTIGRIFEFLHNNLVEPAIITRETLPPIIAVLVEALKDSAHIVYQVCGAISKLANGFSGSGECIAILYVTNDAIYLVELLYHQCQWFLDLAGQTSPMSPFFKDTIAALLQCAQRNATYENAKVQISAFEAINDLVRSASRDTLDVVAQLITVRTLTSDNKLYHDTT